MYYAVLIRVSPGYPQLKVGCIRVTHPYDGDIAAPSPCMY